LWGVKEKRNKTQGNRCPQKSRPKRGWGEAEKSRVSWTKGGKRWFPWGVLKKVKIKISNTNLLCVKEKERKAEQKGGNRIFKMSRKRGRTAGVGLGVVTFEWLRQKTW